MEQNNEFLLISVLDNHLSPQDQFFSSFPHVHGYGSITKKSLCHGYELANSGFLKLEG